MLSVRAPRSRVHRRRFKGKMFFLLTYSSKYFLFVAERHRVVRVRTTRIRGPTVLQRNVYLITQRLEFGLQRNEVVDRAVYAVDPIVIRNIVAEICHGRFENRR